MKQLSAAGKPMNAVPAAQPQGVHELSQRLFDTYTVDQGNVHLGGCTLDDRPLLRLTFLEQEELTSHREVLTLFFLQDLTIDDISRVIGVPAGTVKSRLHYARRALRRALAQEDQP